MNWNKVCNHKEEGGLGFRKSKEVNLACTMKLALGFISKPKSLWVKVMRSEYEYLENILLVIRKRTKASNACRGIIQIWPHFKQNLIWRIGNG